MVGHGGSSAGSYLADPTSPIPSHCASIVATSTLRVNGMEHLQLVLRLSTHFGNVLTIILQEHCQIPAYTTASVGPITDTGKPMAPLFQKKTDVCKTFMRFPMSPLSLMAVWWISRSESEWKICSSILWSRPWSWPLTCWLPLSERSHVLVTKCKHCI